MSLRGGERPNGEIRSWQFNWERKEEIGGKREEAGIGFNSGYEGSMTCKGQPPIILDTSSHQSLHVYFHHKYSGIESQSVPPPSTKDLLKFRIKRTASSEMYWSQNTWVQLEQSFAGHQASAEFSKVCMCIPEDTLWIVYRSRTLWSLFYLRLIFLCISGFLERGRVFS